MNPKKRRFSDCEELKATLGSQFRQYVCKTILASELNTLRQKLEIHERASDSRHVCASCRVPASEKPNALQRTAPDVRCPECKFTLSCGWAFCSREKTSHKCHVCGSFACNAFFPDDIFCTECDKPMCEDCQNHCLRCDRVCKACAPPFTDDGGAVFALPTLQTLPTEHCVKHAEHRSRWRRIYEICLECCLDRNDEHADDPPSCSNPECDGLVCIHDARYNEMWPKCPEHQ